MKKLLFLAICFLGLNFAASAQKESEKTLVKTLDPTGASSIAFLFKNAGINATATPQLTMRVELEIHANMDETTLTKLIAAGRYTLEGKMEGEAFNIYAPNLEKRVTVGGTDLEEQIHIIVKMPPNYLYDKEKQIIVRDLTDFVQRGPEEIAKMKIFNDLKMDVSVKLVKTKPSKTTAKPSKKSNGKKGESLNFLKEDNKNKNLTDDDNKSKNRHGDILIDNVPLEGY